MLIIRVMQPLTPESSELAIIASGVVVSRGELAELTPTQPRERIEEWSSVNDKIVTSYNGIEIEYHIGTNKWRYIVGGKEYDSDSVRLAQVKIEEIQKAVALKRRKNFEAIPAFNGFKHGRITSIAEGQSWRGNNSKQVWFVEDDGTRSKCDVKDLLKDIAQNRDIITKIEAMRAEERSLRAELVHMSDSDLPALDAEVCLSVEV